MLKNEFMERTRSLNFINTESMLLLLMMMKNTKHPQECDTFNLKKNWLNINEFDFDV